MDRITSHYRMIERVRSTLLLDHPWYGALALRLRPVADSSVAMMSTDGTQLTYNPDWLSETPEAIVRTVLAAEATRCALLHPYRMGERDAKRWNTASLLTVTPLLKAAGMQLWQAAPYEARFEGESVESVYATLEHDEQQQQEQQSAGAPQAEPQPGLEPAPPSKSGQGDQQSDEGQGEPQQEQMSATDWQIAAEQLAMVSRKAGTMGSDADRALKASRESETDWRSILHRFVEHVVPKEYSWAHPNRRMIASGFYLPGQTKENTPKLGVAIDTSSSISPALLAAFAEELTSILHEVRPESVEVVYCNTQVTAVQVFFPDDGEIVLNARGGGGTAFQPALDWFSQQSDEQPAAVIYLTDLEARPPTEPSFPVLWAVPEYCRLTEPFGELVKISVRR